MTIEDLLRSSAYPQKPILEKLICHACGLTKTELFTHIEREITSAQAERIRTSYLAYTQDTQPLEYILGYVEFSGLRFSVTSATLIPRPETEYMIEAVREFLEEENITPYPSLPKRETSPFDEGGQGGRMSSQGDLEEAKKPRGHLPYNPALKERAKTLRNNMTQAEKKIWYQYLRQLPETINRQKPIDNYIVDFYCAQAKLVIEIDGETHGTEQGEAYDQKRTEALEGHGLKVLRFTNEEIYNEFDGVCRVIDEYIESRVKSPPPPFTKGGDVTLLDIGTGCGVLGLSVLYHCGDNINHAILADLSEEALDIAQKNYEDLFNVVDKITPTPSLPKRGTTHVTDGKEITFVQANLLDHPAIKEAIITAEHLLLVANLPYIPDQMFDENVDEGVKKREPKMAFVGGDDGLDLYREMFDQLLEIIEPDKITPNPSLPKRETSPFDKGGKGGHMSSQGDFITMFLEMMTRQVAILRKEYEKHFRFEEVKTFHFNIRIVRVTKN